MNSRPPSSESRAAGDLRERLVAELRQAGCVFAEDEADQALAALFDDQVDPADGQAGLRDYVRRRASGEPAEYILGSAPLAGVTVQVGPGAFIPRPWSAVLVGRAAELLTAEGGGRGVDLGTGSGAISLAVARLEPRSLIWATDIDPDAVRWAKTNCAGVPAVAVCLGDLYEALPHSLAQHIDVIFGSLPYVPTEELTGLPRDHVTNEPLIAFDGGEKGLALIARALTDAHRWLRPGGNILLEIGAGQGPGAAAAAAAGGLANIAIHTDGESGELFLEATARL